MRNADTITDEQCRSLLGRILASTQFRKSPKLSAFLSYICELDRTGQTDSINEQAIGTNVFGRTEGYHVGEDSIVRSQARFLRQRLSDYFANAGREEAVVLCIPKGCYVPSYGYREALGSGPSIEINKTEEQAAASISSSVDDAAAPLVPQKRNAGWGWKLAPLLAVVCLAAAATLFFLHRPTSILEARETAESRFWSAIFDVERTQIIVPSDSSMVLLEKISGHTISLVDYMSRRYLNDAPRGDLNDVWSAVASSQYTSLADLNLVSRLERRSEALRTNVQIRYSRDLALDELKHSNAILIGGKRSNPWVTLFAPMMHYNVDYDEKTKQNYVSNRDQGKGEVERYSEAGNGEQHAAYGVIAYLPSLDGQGHALLVGGTSKAGTEAAAEFLFSSRFAVFLRSFSSDRALPHFELLIVTQNTNGESHDGRIINFHRLE